MDGTLTPGQPIHAETIHRVTSWYSRRMALSLVVGLFLIVQSLTFLIPPLQSPDEAEHLERAYLLSKGQIFLDSQRGITGGDVDTGFIAYKSLFQELLGGYDHKVTGLTIRSSKRIAWSGNTQFQELFTTAAYFPLPYAPQALAIFLGEHIGLTVDATYHLARLFSLLATLSLLLAALLSYPTPLIVIALFLTPMSLFQLGSASLDAVTFGTCALAASLFLRGCDNRFSFDSRMHLALAVCVFSLASSRFNLLALTLLPALLARIRGSSAYWISSVIAFCLSLGWVAFAAITVKGMPALQMSTADLARYYLTNPGALAHILFSTLGNAGVLQSYWAEFIGVLGGWVDTLLDPYVYALLGILLFLLAAILVGQSRDRMVNFAAASLLCVALLSVVSLLLIELLKWTPFPSKFIWGIQGRYYTPTLILVGYALFRRRPSALGVGVSLSVIFIESMASVIGMAPKLLARYWLT